VETMDETYRGMADLLKSYAVSNRLYLSPEGTQAPNRASYEWNKGRPISRHVGDFTRSQGHHCGRAVNSVEGNPRSHRASCFRRYSGSGGDGAVFGQKMAAAGHGDRHRSDRKRAACRRVSRICGNGRPAPRVLRAREEAAIQAWSCKAAG